MAVRSSMAALISRLRISIGDTGTPRFTDQQIQDILDLHRFPVRYAQLAPGVTINAGALYTFLDYYADVGDWEDDYVLAWVNFVTITPSVSEPIAGHWQFSQATPGYYPPVFITGKYYDLHAAAAELLEQWAIGYLTTAYDFSTDGQSFKRSQIITNLQMAADRHRALAMPTTSMTIRGDGNISTDSGMILWSGGV